MDFSTIAAIASPAGAGGIGVIKISGPDAVRVTADIFHPGTPGTVRSKGELDSWRIHYGYIVDPESGRVYDEVIVAVMRGPCSYTREDVVEIQAHAGPAVLSAIMGLLMSRGIRLAEPGEFTRRAFLNGRIDLTQAESVIDMINARSVAALDIAASLMTGGLKTEIKLIRAVIVDVLSRIEAMVDFPEDVEDEVDVPGIAAQLTDSVHRSISELIARHDAEDILRTGFRVVIAGGPNVGKSSLLNCLTGIQRAIVSDQPGTTRDFIEATMLIRGVPVVLADTAGLRANPDPLERLGIEKALEYIDMADVILLVLDAGVAMRAEDLRFFGQIAGKQVILVVNKIDLPPEKCLFRIPSEWEEIPRVETSALYAQGIDSLKKAIADHAGDFSSGSTGRLVPNLRHRNLLERALQSVAGAISGLESGASPEFISIDLRSAFTSLNEITGENVDPEVLNRIFDQYCIGK